MTPARQRGFTLTELMVTVVVGAILVGTAVPSFLSTIARGRLEGVANELAVDLQYTRSEALRRRLPVTLAVDAAGTSYTIEYTDPLAGTTVTVKTVTMPTAVSVAGTAAIVFDGLRGLANAETLNVTSSQVSAQLRLLTNANGRVQMCSPSGSMPAYPSC